ncbi:hypothetical protein HPB50_012318 [Hyalomma asiaticum]|uniref:Uncharacterized protein n=1 Tax=Hyalomma asiaticum TaxID=266040 RepID=A0ACB7SD78_HYAAI|nr:hypothetical protein HPB50_012318 [Hyalomma asiaticum]
MVLTFMEQHPELAQKAGELQHGLTIAYKRRLRQQLTDTLYAVGSVSKTTVQWQEWWRKHVHEARHDATAVTEAQRHTGEGRAPGFRGRVLQVTGMIQVAGLPDGLPYQEQNRTNLPEQWAHRGWPLNLCFGALCGHDLDCGHDELTRLCHCHHTASQCSGFFEELNSSQAASLCQGRAAAAQEAMMGQLHSLVQAMTLHKE